MQHWGSGTLGTSETQRQKNRETWFTATEDDAYRGRRLANQAAIEAGKNRSRRYQWAISVQQAAHSALNLLRVEILERGAEIADPR